MHGRLLSIGLNANSSHLEAAQVDLMMVSVNWRNAECLRLIVGNNGKHCGDFDKLGVRERVRYHVSRVGGIG